LCVCKPHVVAAEVLRHLNAATGMSWRIRGPIRPRIFPHPGLGVSGVSLLAASTEQERQADASRPLLQVKTLRLSLAFSSLLTLSPRFHRIELDEPVINLAYDAHNRPLWLVPPKLDGRSGEEKDTPPAREKEEYADTLKRAADMVCSLPPFAGRPVQIRNGRLTSWNSAGDLLFSFTGLTGSFLPGGESENLHLSATFALPAAGLELSAQLAARVGQDGIPARGSLSGRVLMTPPGSRTLSGDFAGSFTWLASGKEVMLPDFRLAAESDALTADLAVDLSMPECTGMVRIHKLSLPRWFSFGRVLPPGLRQTLDSLVGEFVLQFDRNRAEARNLRVITGSLAVGGYVGTPDFTRPVVVVDLDVGRADLDKIFPFLTPPDVFPPAPTPPVFDHPPLAPYPQPPGASPSSPDKDPGIDVGYDVKVRVARPRVHSVEGGPLEVTVRPEFVKNVEKTRVAFTASSLLGGAVDGRLDIDAASILMRYDARTLELELLPENVRSTVRIAGKTTGVCEIDVPLRENGDLADDWDIRVDAAISGCDIAGNSSDAPWSLHSANLSVAGPGKIHAVPGEGIRIEGQWDLEAKEVRTSWNPEGKDAVAARFVGGLFWPPMSDIPGPPAKDPRFAEKRGLDRMAGSLEARGSLVVPLGSLPAPVTGRLAVMLDWRLYDETLALEKMTFEGFGSYAEGFARVDLSGRESALVSEVQYAINPASLLQGWKIALPEGMIPPKLLKGKSSITGKSRFVRFDKIKMEMDGAPITGEISWQGGEKALSDAAGLWTFRLNADHLNLDALFPPSPPGAAPAPSAKKPWNLLPLKGLGIDARISLPHMKKDRLTFTGTKVTGALQQDRFSLHAALEEFYGGSGTVFFQGTVAPEKSQVNLHKGLAQLRGISLGELLRDYTEERSYAGTAELVVDMTGHLSSNADIPARLSGVWNLTIEDGLYPAFMTGENSNLRNTFSLASLSGVLDQGVLRSDNFTLKGPMVDMTGGGWLDLNAKTCDFNLSATFAKVPTVPVRFYGSTRAPRMQVRGVDMGVATGQNAGMTVFGLVRGILTLPAHAARGISALFQPGGAEKKKRASPKE
jgi:AsmA protein